MFDKRETMRVPVTIEGQKTKGNGQALISDDGLIALSIDGEENGAEIFQLIKSGFAVGINIKPRYTEAEEK